MKNLIERRRQLKQKLQSRETLYVAWTSLAHPSITEIFCQSPFDFIGIDVEHGVMSIEQCQAIILAAQSRGSLCLPRIASHNMEMTKRLMDAGADGVIVPMISTADQAQNMISWMKYPTQGRRSFGVARAQGYGNDFDEYIKSWNETSSFIVQVECLEGVNNIESIAAIKDVDGIMVGPYDLSGSLGIPGQLEHKKVKAACQKVLKACQEKGKSCGTQIVAPNADNIQQAFKDGFTFVVLASDIFVLWKWVENIGQTIQAIQK